MASIPSLLTGAVAALGALNGTLNGTLPQQETNGESLFGTLDAPTYPEFLTNNPLPDGFPWGPLTAEGNSPYRDAPATGITRRYNFNVHRAVMYPDGVRKEMIVVNNQFPGPTIEANWGDWIEVTVRNNLDQGTALHWHGLLQKETPWFDGVPSVMQCPIAPGSTFTYRFRADLYGSSWWHSHYSAQYSGGMLGPMIIHGPSHLKGKDKYDVDVGPVFITDWYHREYFDIVKDVVSTDIGKVIGAGISNNNLINGKMAFQCNKTTVECKPGAGMSQFRFRSGKRHLLRLINGGAEGQQRFSVDEHDMTVIAHDFVPIKPYTVKELVLGIGQRADVIVQGKQDPKKSYFMRANIQTACTGSTQPDALAVILYPGADPKKPPTSTPQPDNINCASSSHPLEDSVPVFPIGIKTPDITHNIEISLGQNATGFWLWRMNGVPFRANFNNPILLLANKGNFSYPQEWNVFNNEDKKVVRVILKNRTGARHPMHLHGHNMQMLSSGPGDWDGSSIVNQNNPSRRDTQVIDGNGHFVFQYEADNPGVWPFHCHIAWHVSGGLYVNLMERTSDIRRRMQIPQIMPQTCRDWWKFTDHAIVEQIDSGL